MKGTTRSLIVVLTMTAIVATVAVGAAVAAKGGKGHHNTSGSNASDFGLVLVDSPDNVPNWGETVTFNVATSATDQPSVKVSCYQGDVWVYSHFGFFYPDASSPSAFFTLRSSVWTGGGADCTAELYYMNMKGESVTLATFGFQVYD